MLDCNIYNIFNEYKYLVTLISISIFIILHFLKKTMILMWQPHNYEDKSVLITGCDTGFGYNAAIQLDKLNVKVFAACFTTAGVKRLKDDKNFHGVVLLLDVTSQKDIDGAFQLIQKHLKDQGILDTTIAVAEGVRVKKCFSCPCVNIRQKIIV